ncbi:uncharacterized protein DS421_2g57180 [Arachis hypogaea]|nr:uncharacterized protein DS421_2g57180 [Arachis hypogaea]
MTFAKSQNEMKFKKRPCSSIKVSYSSKCPIVNVVRANIFYYLPIFLCQISELCIPCNCDFIVSVMIVLQLKDMDGSLMCTSEW